MNTYIHIPFCRQKCSYCKFALTPVFNDYKKKKYLHFLEKEIKEKLKKFSNRNIETIYFGGGTPSVLEISEIEKILKNFPEGNKEISFESNPEDINENFLEALFSLGINRLSLGIQSLNNDTLKSTERKSKETIFSAFNALQKFQIGNKIIFQEQVISINADFILGLPFTKKGEILENIKFLHQKYPFITHTSVYILEEGLYPKSWKNNSISHQEISEEFLQICHFFQKKGWNHYEVSNFSEKNFECKHNSGYWKHTETLGFGLSASEGIYDSQTHFLFKRSTNALSFSGYYQGKKASEEYLNEEQIEIEKFLFGMRTNGYIPNKKFPIISKEKVEKFLENGLLIGNKKHFRPSEQGIIILDHIIDEIII